MSYPLFIVVQLLATEKGQSNAKSRAKARESLEQIVYGRANAYGALAEISWPIGYLPIFNGSNAVAILRRVMEVVCGNEVKK